MKKLLRLHFQMNYKAELLVLALLAIFFIGFSNLSLMPVLFALIITRQSNHHDTSLLKTWMAMPIERAHIVGARFSYEAIVTSAYVGIPGVILLIKKPIELFDALAVVTIFIILFNTIVSQSIAYQFSAKSPDVLDLILFVMPAIGVIAIHIICIAIADSNGWLLLMLPVTMLSFIFLRHYYKRSVKQLALKQFT